MKKVIECPSCKSSRGHHSSTFGWWCQDCQKWYKDKKDTVVAEDVPK